MNSAFQHLIDVANGPLSETAFKSVLHKLASECGYKYFAYANLRGSESSAISSYPQEWQKLYFERDFFRIDPVIAHAKRGSYIYNWVSDTAQSGVARDIVDFYGDAREFGIHSGFSISVPTGFGHQAVLTLASDQRKSDLINPAHTQLAIAATAMIHMALNGNSNALSKEIDLTPREATCLRWIAEGKSNQEVADLLGISFRSVRSYLDGAKRKLSAHNAIQAVAIATRLRLI